MHIVSTKIEALCEAIVEHLGKNGTIVHGRASLKTNQAYDLFGRRKRAYSTLEELIQTIDKEAFMVVMEASELLGRGH